MFRHHHPVRSLVLRPLAAAWLLAALALTPAYSAIAQDATQDPAPPAPAQEPAPQPVQEPAQAPLPETQPAPVQPTPAQPVTLTGQVAVLWGDLVGPDDRVQQSTVSASLLTEAGDVVPLTLDRTVVAQAGGWPALHNATVQVAGSLDATGQLQVASLSTLPAPDDTSGATESDEPLAGEPVVGDASMADAGIADAPLVEEAAVTGSRPWVLLLCRGAGSAIVHPSPQPYYNAMLGDDSYGMGHFWREQSYGKANVLGSQSVGWLDLPKPAAAYEVSYAGGLSIDQESTFNDCTKAADPYVDFSKFTGVGIFMPLPSTAGFAVWFWGGTHVIRLDGKTRLISTVWMPMEIGETSDNDVTDVNVLAHEMGHGFGLPHSSGPYGEVYDSTWDLMSGSGGARCTRNLPYGCPGQHTIAVHKEWLGWLNANQIVTVADKTSSTVLLERVAQPTGTGVLLVKAPIGASGRYYTVETRQLVGYDTVLAAEAVIIHEVDEQRDESPAQVVDPDGNGDVNDVGAEWLPGERFEGEGGVVVCVVSRTPTGFRVAVGRNVQPNCSASADLSYSAITAANTLPRPGQVVPITVSLVNSGVAAANVVVTSTLPAATTYVSGTVRTSQGAVKLASPGQVVVSVGALGYNSTATLSYNVTVSNALTLPTVINIPATVTWNQGSSPVSLSAQMVTNAVRLNIPRLSK